MNKITVVSNIKKDPTQNFTHKIIEYISHFADVIWLDEKLAYNSPDKVFYTDAKSLFSDTDAVITIGGDGTILRIATDICRKHIPVLGINLGRVGFMAELETNEIGLISNLFKNRFVIEPRMMLDVDVIREGEVKYSFTVLNEAVIMHGSVSKMIELQLECNGGCISSYNADGLILSTPTGSTAYSLSAGGAIVDPSFECIQVTPVCAHSLYNSRPVIFSHASELFVSSVGKADEDVYLTLDGRENVLLLYKDVVSIKKSKYTTDLIKIKNTHFYDTVYNKLSERK